GPRKRFAADGDGMTRDHLRRRTFMALVGAAGASAVLSRAGHAQQTGRPLVGGLSSGRTDQAVIAAFKQGVSGTGLGDGIGVDIEYRWADDQYDRLAALSNELVARKVWVIAAIDLSAALAAKPAVTKVPLVFVMAGDPIKFGLVNNLAQPSDKVTGII